MFGSRIASGRFSGDVELLHLEIATAEQEARQAQEAGIADSRRVPARAAPRPRRRTTPAALSARTSAALREAQATRSPTSRPRRRLSPAGSSTTSRAPRHETVRHGPTLVLDLDHDLVGVEEDRVDREAHERGVDAPAGPEHHPLALPQVLAPEQPSHAPMCTVGHDDSLADDPAVLSAERQCGHGVR